MKINRETVRGYNKLFYGNWQPTHIAKVDIREQWQWLTERPLTGGRLIKRKPNGFTKWIRGAKLIASK